MKFYLHKYGILFFFCFSIGIIIMAEVLIAAGLTIRERGYANTFSKYTMKLSIVQADSHSSWLQSDFSSFLNANSEKQIQVMKQSGITGAEYYSGSGVSQGLNDYGKSIYSAWTNTSASGNQGKDGRIYYNGTYYNIAGEYSSSKENEKFIVDMRGEMSDNPDKAVYGIYYIDCKTDTLVFVQSVMHEILSKNPYAQVTIIEENANSHLLKQMFQSENSLYYLIQMTLLIVLNILNFIQVTVYWSFGRSQEVYVRKLIGGEDGSVFFRILSSFIFATALFTALGMIAGTLIAALAVKLSWDGVLLGMLCGLMQCAVLDLFATFVFHRAVKQPILLIKHQVGT